MCVIVFVVSYLFEFWFVCVGNWVFVFVCFCVLRWFVCCCVVVYVFVFAWGRCSHPSVAQLVERSTVVVDTVRGILRNRLVTSSILVVRTSLLLLPFASPVAFAFAFARSTCVPFTPAQRTCHRVRFLTLNSTSSLLSPAVLRARLIALRPLCNRTPYGDVNPIGHDSCTPMRVKRNNARKPQQKENNKNKNKNKRRKKTKTKEEKKKKNENNQTRDRTRHGEETPNRHHNYGIHPDNHTPTKQPTTHEVEGAVVLYTHTRSCYTLALSLALPPTQGL